MKWKMEATYREQPALCCGLSVFTCRGCGTRPLLNCARFGMLFWGIEGNSFNVYSTVVEFTRRTVFNKKKQGEKIGRKFSAEHWRQTPLPVQQCVCTPVLHPGRMSLLLPCRGRGIVLKLDDFMGIFLPTELPHLWSWHIGEEWIQDMASLIWSPSWVSAEWCGRVCGLCSPSEFSLPGREATGDQNWVF